MATELSSRDLERLINNKTQIEEADIFFATFSSDIGTIRNLGRRGSSFGPTAILNVVKKLSCHHLLKWSEGEIANMEEEKVDFSNAQEKSKNRLTQAINQAKKAQKIIYIGGGHDHIYPVAMAMNQYISKLVVINLDAHLDTRTDLEANSGTPFRQLDRDFKGELEIIQIGINEYANSISTMSNLKNAREVVATYEDVRHGTLNFYENDKFLKRIIPYKKDATYLFSLDVDVIDGSQMEAVSAVSHRGLPYNFIEDTLVYCIQELQCQHFGIFEYNPVYDNLSQKGARSISSLIYQIMDEWP